MSNRRLYLATAVIALLTASFFAGASLLGSGAAEAAAALPAPGRGAVAPNVVISNPPTQAPVAAAPALAPAPLAAAPAAPAPAAAAPAGAAAANAAAGPPAAAPRIVVIDRNVILQGSLAGKDIMTQMQTLSRTAETQLKTEEGALIAEATQLQQQLAIMAPDVRDQKEKEFTAKQTAFQTRVQTRQAEVQAGFNKATGQIETALGPIIREIMIARGANMVMDRASVILSTADIDITQQAVQRLDRTLPRVRVEVTPLPPGAVGPAVAGRAGAPAVATPAAAPGRR